LILKQPVTGPAAWKGAELAGDNSWIHQLTEVEVTEIDAALQSLTSRGIEFPGFSAVDFELPTLRAKLQTIATELETGRGFLLLRGLPVQRYSDDEIRIIYYGLGLNMGSPVGQNPKGDLIGLVANVGDLSKKTTRVYETNAYLPYHTDPSDVVGLLCLRKARRGGLSSLVSSAAVYNELLANHREYLALFYRPFYYAHLGKDKPGLSPLFSYHNGKLSCRYLRQYIELGHEIMELPLSQVEVDALDLFDSIIHDESLRLDMMLEPGDLQFANNYAVMHSRTAFEDDEDPALHRKMLRLWLKMPNARQLAPDFPGRNGFPVPPSAAGA
jgi:hypothetical protein